MTRIKRSLLPNLSDVECAIEINVLVLRPIDHLNTLLKLAGVKPKLGGTLGKCR